MCLSRSSDGEAIHGGQAILYIDGDQGPEFRARSYGERPSGRCSAARSVQSRNSQCDPGLASIADHLGICSRTVIRSIRQLVSAGLIVKVRHGGYSHRNSYQPIWERFRQLEAEWSSRLHRRRSFTKQESSSSDGRPCHVGSDKPVTQASKENLHKKTCSSGRPNEESVDDARRLKFISGRIRPGGAAHAAADVVGVTGIIGNGACSAIVIPIATGGIATGVGGNTVTERGPLGGGLYAEIGK